MDNGLWSISRPFDRSPRGVPDPHDADGWVLIPDFIDDPVRRIEDLSKAFLISLRNDTSTLGERSELFYAADDPFSDTLCSNWIVSRNVSDNFLEIQ